MFLHRDKQWWDAAIERAERTVAQALVGQIPAGVVITPIMIQEANWQIVYVLLAWVITSLIEGLISLMTSYAKGIPEVE